MEQRGICTDSQVTCCPFERQTGLVFGDRPAGSLTYGVQRRGLSLLSCAAMVQVPIAEKVKAVTSNLCSVEQPSVTVCQHQARVRLPRSWRGHEMVIDLGRKWNVTESFSPGRAFHDRAISYQLGIEVRVDHIKPHRFNLQHG